MGRVDVETRNGTSEDLTEVAVWFGDAPCTTGVLIAGAQATHLFFDAPITRVARVEWKDASGKRHLKEAQLGGTVQAGDSGVLQVLIKGDHVEVRLLPLPRL
jgi:hypothetical protein